MLALALGLGLRDRMAGGLHVMRNAGSRRGIEVEHLPDPRRAQRQFVVGKLGGGTDGTDGTGKALFAQVLGREDILRYRWQC